MKKQVRVKISNSRQYAALLNGIFKLTERELDVIAQFIDLSMEYPDLNVFSSDFKRRVGENLEMNDFNVLNIYVSTLNKKKAITRKGKSIYDLNKLFKIRPELSGIEFTWEPKTK